MKHFVPFLKTCMLAATVFTLNVAAFAQGEFSFTNAAHESGSALANGAVYRYSNVGPNLDALVTIRGRSSNQVRITTLDITNTGFHRAFQPQIRFGDGSVSGAQNWWVEFQVDFVSSRTTIPVIVNEFYTTALDIDGDDERLREWAAFYAPTAYTVESNTQLQISPFMVNGANVGHHFLGSSETYNGIDTSATRVMASVLYKNTSRVTFRMGGVTTGSTENAERLYSVWFRNFVYAQPSSLPVKLVNFTGIMHNNQASLQWQVEMNQDADYFEVQRSTNGRDFNRAAMVLPTPAQGTENYSFREQVNGAERQMYRLKLVDKNGTITYSRVIVMNPAASNQQTVKLTGNPVTNKVNFTYAATAAGTLQVRVLDINGRMLQQQVMNKMQGTNFMSVDLHQQLVPGMYILDITDGSDRFAVRFVK